MDTKTIIIVATIAFTNIGTIIVVVCTLKTIGKLMREHPVQCAPTDDYDNKSWHSWRFWRHPDEQEDADLSAENNQQCPSKS